MSKNSTLNRRERKKEETKQSILTTAIQFFQTQGYDATTMEQIAEAVDISKVTLYNYFPSKELIVAEFFQDMSHQFVDQVLDFLAKLPTTRSKIYEYFRGQFEWNLQYRELLQIYFVHQFQSMLQPEAYQNSGMDQVLAQIIRYGQEAGELRQDLPTEYLAKHLEIMYVMEFMVWILEGDSWNPEKHLAAMVDLFMNGAENKSEMR
ncbi:MULTISPECIES: TetR/AcrR family transcriptional regulator [Desulfitobacterium]|uniref:Transcriptional regulator n=1 Tax=Desulfitobacterium dehalogenans (strain ATCC 51507 / DSM 9161 / JW/IU-DC1) TaxID=756499 RepID=I4A5H5_DESDJ|nr:TetR/AcrR family transcriptional regulator [Desulfitobacterium sp. PCE1]AFL99209.1 transcriptional regulator [Desulfitobacterium dehalogenans ATCC 51507]